MKMNDYLLSLVDYFIQHGYVIIDLRELSQQGELLEYENAHKRYLHALKKYFRLDLQEKELSLVDAEIDKVTKCRKSGYWPKEMFDGNPNEFYNSRDFFTSTSSTILDPFNGNEKNGLLPDNEAYAISHFSIEHIVTPFLKTYLTRFDISIPRYAFQIQSSYFDRKSSLGFHTDSGFFEGISGVADGLIVIDQHDKKERNISLKSHEAILYTGDSFQRYYSSFLPEASIPAPLVHAVEAQAERISAPFVCIRY